ncbi:MAG: exosome complex RNA-binding protein Csl4 [Methanosarcinales archaeon]|nr:exosome complex RNA-binding protein Csl4 [Methanosarcinales archaeon]
MGKEKGIVVPGDFLGTSEEFTPGEGVYDEKGNIHASLIGGVSISDKRVIEVQPKVDTPPTLKEGDVVVGRIEDLRDTVAIVSIACLKGHEEREIAASTQGVIHISNVRSGYVNDLQREFGYLDLVKAKVIDVAALRLSTEGEDLGVIKAICAKCKKTLKRKGNTLACESCKRVEVRNISEDYGKGLV